MMSLPSRAMSRAVVDGVMRRYGRCLYRHERCHAPSWTMCLRCLVCHGCGVGMQVCVRDLRCVAREPLPCVFQKKMPASVQKPVSKELLHKIRLECLLVIFSCENNPVLIVTARLPPLWACVEACGRGPCQCVRLACTCIEEC